MGTCRLDDNFHSHPKAIQVGPYGRDLYIAGLEYCNRLFTDGFIPRAAVPTLASGLPSPMRIAKDLVDAVLWEETIGGFQVHDWREMNPPAAGRKAKVLAERDRKRAWRENQRKLLEAGRNGTRDAASVHELSQRDTHVPVPSRGRLADAQAESETESEKNHKEVENQHLLSSGAEDAPPQVTLPGTPEPAGKSPRVRFAADDPDAWKHAPWPSPEALAALYNERAPEECQRIATLSEGRKQKARQSLGQFPKREWWEATFEQVQRSPVLRGLKPSPGHEHFRADFDWLLSKGQDRSENAVKTHDGKYREGATPPTASAPVAPPFRALNLDPARGKTS